MKFKQFVGLALLIVGGVLLYFAHQATSSPLEMASEALTGRYTDETTWHLILGCVCTLGGLGLLIFGRR